MSVLLRLRGAPIATLPCFGRTLTLCRLIDGERMGRAPRARTKTRCR